MNLVPQPETTTEAEKPAVPLWANEIAAKLPAGMVESLKAIRHELGLLHAHCVNELGQIPSYIGGAYQAIDDAEGFLKTVANGGELYTPVPKKPEIKEENKPSTDNTIKVPSNLRDIPYMQEWAGTCVFPKIRELTSRTDVEVYMRAGEVKKKLHLVFSITIANEPAVLLPGRYKPNSVMDLVEIAKSIDAL